MIWQYRTKQILNVTDNLEATLNQLGAEGWELVCLHPRGPHTELILKRPDIGITLRVPVGEA